MKKSMIAAGVSAVALAAMPVVGVFATTTAPDGTIYGSPLIDQFNITLTEVCTLSRDGTPHTNPATVGVPIGGSTPVAAVTGAWSTDGTNANKDIFTATLVPGSAYAGIATSKYDITCNSAVGGYNVTVATTGFEKSGADTWSYVAETDFNGSDASQWFLTSSAIVDGSEDPVAIENGDPVWSTSTTIPTSAVTTDNFTITYNIMAKTTQQVGAYTASATYTLANL